MLIYIDNILVFIDGLLEEHYKHVQIVFKQL